MRAENKKNLDECATNYRTALAMPSSVEIGTAKKRLHLASVKIDAAEMRLRRVAVKIDAVKKMLIGLTA